MNNNDYMAALRRALAGMQRGAREEILREIKSHLNEASDAVSLQERFGPVDELARQYLDGEPKKMSWFSRLGKVTKVLLVGLGAVSLAVALIIVGVVWFFSGDRFDYSDESLARQEIAGGQRLSITSEQQPSITIKQAKAAIYWHDEPEVRWLCKGREPVIPKAGFAFEVLQGYCLFYLPKNQAKIDVSQGEVVIVRPQATISLTLDQGWARIAENGESYRYELDVDKTEVDEFKSDPEALVSINIASRMATVSHYEHR